MRSFVTLCALALSLNLISQTPLASSRPNIIILYADDLGYGDVSCYGAHRLETPNIDRLAKSGLKFTDAHCSAATCTPSRYSLLTGSYAFRARAAILPGDAPLIIHPGTTTLPSILKKAGYKTGVVGKWHLGLGDGITDWNGEIKPGPLEIGFDYCYIIPSTADRVPCVYVENHKVVDLDPYDPIRISYDHPVGNNPTGLSNPELLKFRADTQHSQTIINGVSRIGYMAGGNSAQWQDEQFAFRLLQKSRQFIENNKNGPFFLYFAFSDIHVPRMPNPQFHNSSKMGTRGDAILQMDWCCGQIIQLLKQLNLEDKTLIIFSSDNGPIVDDGYVDMAVNMLGDHHPSGPYRGGKYSSYEGGTRVPFIVSWPKNIKPGVNNALINQVDILASIAGLIGQPLCDNDAGDSFNLLPVLLGNSDKGRTLMLEEAFSYALRLEEYKYIQKASGSAPDWLRNKDVETGISDFDQLFNLKDDPHEINNLSDKEPEKLKEMKVKLNEILKHESRPGF